MDHDQNFKNLILDYPLDALRFFAPDEAPALSDQAKITPIRQEQLKQRLGDRFRELDVPLLVEWPNGQREALLFVVEEESKASLFSIHRLVHYCVDLSELLKTERVVPVVIFLGKGSRKTHLDLGGDRHKYLQFHYLSCALGDIPWEQHRHSNNLVARLNLPNMKYTDEQVFDVYTQATHGLIELEPDPDKQLKYIEFIDKYANLSDNDRMRYYEIYPQEKHTMSTYMARQREQAIKEGLQEGVQQGMQQGMQQGEAVMLLRQIEAKFGKPSADVKSRITQASSQTLLQWSDRILTADKIENVWH